MTTDSHSLRSTIAADLRALRLTQDRYGLDGERSDPPPNAPVSARTFAAALVGNIGFQQLAAFRLCAWFAQHRLVPLAKLGSRMIRHCYGAEMHWEADVAPGVILVHGNGLVISRAAAVGPGCILAQSVTLGISRGADGTSGAPRLEANVHVGPGAVVVGPITIGEHSKIAPNSFVSTSVPARSTVAPPPVTTTPR